MPLNRRLRVHEGRLRIWANRAGSFSPAKIAENTRNRNQIFARSEMGLGKKISSMQQITTTDDALSGLLLSCQEHNNGDFFVDKANFIKGAMSRDMSRRQKRRADIKQIHAIAVELGKIL